MCRVLSKKGGFTLIEAVVAMGVFLIISTLGTSMLLYANNIGGRILVKNELLENARIALDFTINQLRFCEDFYIETSGTSMQRLIVWYRETDGSSDIKTHEFRFNPDTGILSFGGQRLAAFIKDIRLEYSGDCINIYVVTSDRISESSLDGESIVLKAIVSLKNKNRRMHA